MEDIVDLTIDTANHIPIYRQIMDRIARDIARGILPPGYQLPTVRDLAERSGISHGTIKHAYDMLEREGLIKKNRGSGTFVAFPKEIERGGAKVKALAAIDHLLDEMEQLSFSPRDIRIFLDLKLREREEHIRQVTVAAVDCSPEPLSVMYRQILDLPHTEVYKYLLDEVITTPKPFDPAADLVVTTPTHYEDLARKMLHGREPTRLVMAIATSTALELAAIPPDTRLGIACASRRFAQVMLRACEEYGKLLHPVEVVYFGDGDSLSRIARECNRLLLPPNYELFSSPVEALILKSVKESHRPIHYRYQVERGSLLYLEEQINRIYKNNQGLG
ncbi:MAG: GntR family transcriptional regulator, partial [Spirochaetaceae bacterium]|jgi:DNA-binding transcriptional regulator YhcF (GntR family)|nr:GntR family transcriptional regulator [Spirochaetaceae bacterium]